MTMCRVCVCLPQRQLSPRSIYRSCPAATRNTWELFGAPHDGSNSEVPPCPTPPPLSFKLLEQNRQTQSTSKFPFGEEKTKQID
ncbi:hypothetical protein QQF64_006086 [Cirrhinus molitorella]|uniref:Uncharacterized protein n=1 Tax=Cirrhinus molitorella TaxID=172907 RepID=A0ABR3ME46_9TELE